MAGRPVQRAQVKALDDIGEAAIIQMLEDGTTLREFFNAFDIGRRAWYQWLDMVEGRRQAMEEARTVYAESLDAESMDLADACLPDREHVSKTKLQVETRRQRAQAVDKTRREKAPPPSTVINIANLHLSALKERMNAPPALPPASEGEEGIVVEADWEEEGDANSDGH